jgi:hypothetical protein
MTPLHDDSGCSPDRLVTDRTADRPPNLVLAETELSAGCVGLGPLKDGGYL